MVYSITYARPRSDGDIRNSTSSEASAETKQRSLDDSIRSCKSCPMTNGIPEALSFDRIMNGGVCPPCSIRDFMNYLKYIEHAAENLQFFLWLKDYTLRFKQLDPSQLALAKEWTMSPSETELLASTNAREKRKLDGSPGVPNNASLGASTTSSDADLRDPNGKRAVSPFNAMARHDSQESGRTNFNGSEKSFTGYSATQATSLDYRLTAAAAFSSAGLVPPFSLQAFRDELNRVVTIYIVSGGPRQLNLSEKQRLALLLALQHTTHPSAFRGVATSIELNLRTQAHPNFIRWTICNGNQPRVLFAHGLGVFGLVAGILVDLLITLSRAHRAWRVIAYLLFLVGIATFIAAYKGMCVVLHGLHHRHLRPWELFADEEDQVEMAQISSQKYERGKKLPIYEQRSMDTLDSYSSYETEPWIAVYQKRNVIRKIFDREVWVEEPALRQIQDTIFLQSILGAVLGAAILVAIFVAVPAGRFY